MENKVDYNHLTPKEHQQATGNLTIREYYAGLFLQASLSKHTVCEKEILVQDAVNYADLLILELKKAEKQNI